MSFFLVGFDSTFGSLSVRLTESLLCLTYPPILCLNPPLTVSFNKTDCKYFNSDDWGEYQRVLPPEFQHHIGKDNTQRLERTNGIVRQQMGKWHRQQNKFGKVWEQTKVTTRLVVSYFNWIWQHSRFKNTAAWRAGLTTRSWSWHDIATYPTLI